MKRISSKRAKACAISSAVKKRVWDRDNHCCVYCKSIYAFPEAHYIPRSRGGLGIEENERIGMPKAVFLSVLYDRGDLLKRAENDHCRGFAAFLRLFFQEPVAEVKILGNVKVAVRIKERFPGFLALAVLVVATDVPHRIGGVSVRAEVVRDVRYNKLRLRYVVLLEILEVVIEKLDFHFFSSLIRQWRFAHSSRIKLLSLSDSVSTPTAFASCMMLSINADICFTV